MIDVQCLVKPYVTAQVAHGSLQHLNGIRRIFSKVITILHLLSLHLSESLINFEVRSMKGKQLLWFCACQTTNGWTNGQERYIYFSQNPSQALWRALSRFLAFDEQYDTLSRPDFPIVNIKMNFMSCKEKC